MLVKYKIVSVNEEEKTFIARYFSDLITEDDLAGEFDIDGDIIRDANGYPVRCKTDVNFSLYDENDSTLENVRSRIVGNIPLSFLKVKEKIKLNTAPSINNVVSVLGEVFEYDTDSLLNGSDSDMDTSAQFDGNIVIKGNLTVTGIITSNTP